MGDLAGRRGMERVLSINVIQSYDVSPQLTTVLQGLGYHEQPALVKDWSLYRWESDQADFATIYRDNNDASFFIRGKSSSERNLQQDLEATTSILHEHWLLKKIRNPKTGLKVGSVAGLVSLPFFVYLVVKKDLPFGGELAGIGAATVGAITTMITLVTGVAISASYKSRFTDDHRNYDFGKFAQAHLVAEYTNIHGSKGIDLEVLMPMDAIA